MSRTRTEAAPNRQNGTAPEIADTLASRLFGFDVFVSFALGPAPRGTHSYASSLVRQLREHGLTVFFSEDVAAPGSTLEHTIHNALKRSRTLLVVCNEGTLLEPRWVRTEVQYFREHNPKRPVVPLSINSAVPNAFDRSLEIGWLCTKKTIWIDEIVETDSESRVSPNTLLRSVLSSASVRVSRRWTIVKSAVTIALATTAVLATGAAVLAEARRVRSQELLADERTENARQRLLLGQWDAAGALLLSVYDQDQASDIQRVMLAAALRPLTWIKMQLQNDSTPALSMTFSSDNQRVAIAHASNSVYVHEVSDGRLIAQLSLQGERIYQVILNATGDRILTVELQSKIDGAPDADYTLSHSLVTTLWDVGLSKAIRTWDHTIVHDDLPTTIEPWASRSMAGAAFRIRGAPDAQDDGATDYAFIDGQPRATPESASPLASLKSTQPNDRSEVALKATNERSQTLIVSSDDGSVVASAGRNGVVEIIDPGKLQTPWKATIEMNVLETAVTSNSASVVALGVDGRLVSISIESGQVTSDVAAEPEARGHALSSDGSRAILWKDNAYLLVDTVTGKNIRKLPADTADARFSSNSKHVASWTAGGSESRITLTVRTAAEGKRAYTTELIGDSFTSFAINGAGTLWNAKSSTHQQSGGAGVADDVFAPHVSKATLTEFLGDSDLSATGLDDGSVAFGSARSGVPAHNGAVTALTQSHDSQLLVSGGLDGAMAVWNVPQRRPSLTLRGHTGKVNSIRLSGDRNSLISASEDGTARLWTLHDGREVLRWRPSGEPVKTVSISPDGGHVITGTAKALHMWAVTKERRSTSALTNATRNKLMTCEVDRGVLRWQPPAVGHIRGSCGRDSG